MSPPLTRRAFLATFGALPVGLAGCMGHEESSAAWTYASRAAPTAIAADAEGVHVAETTPSGGGRVVELDGGVVASSVNLDARVAELTTSAGRYAWLTDGRLVRLADGVRWVAPASTFPPVVSDGVFLAGEDGVYALNPKDGSERWYRDQAGVPAVRADDSLVLVGPDVAAVLDAVDGSARWTRRTDHGDATAVTDGVRVYYGHVGGGNRPVVTAYRLRSGNRAWAVGIREPNAFPVVAGGRCYVASGEHHDWWLSRVDPETGERRWSVSGFVLNAADVDVLAGTRHTRHAVVALNPATGERRWVREIDIHLDHYTPDVWLTDDSLVFAGRRDVRAYAREDGTRRWRETTDTLVEEILTTTDRAYVRTRDRVYAFNA